MIKLYSILKEIVDEGVRYNDDTGYEINYEKDLFDDLVKFSDRISIRKDEYNNIVFVGIPIEKTEYKNKFLNDIKKSTNLDPSHISNIIDKVVDNLIDYINIDEFDYIISPKSSSFLTQSFLNKLKSISTKPTFISDMFLKNDVKNIWLDIETAKKELEPKYVKKLVKSFDRSKKVDGLSMKLQRLGKYHRKYVRDMLIINSDYDNTLLDMLDKKILVVDDLITTGKTLNDIRNLLSNLGKGQIMFFTMFG